MTCIEWLPKFAFPLMFGVCDIRYHWYFIFRWYPLHLAIIFLCGIAIGFIVRKK